MPAIVHDLGFHPDQVKFTCRDNPPSMKDLEYAMEKAIKAGQFSWDNADEHVIKEFTPVSNQGALGSCVANAWADALEILLGIEGKKVVQLSRLFIYWNARAEHKETNWDKGTYMRAAADALRKHGVCPEDPADLGGKKGAWPYLIGKVFTQPNTRCYQYGYDNKIKEYYHVTSSRSSRIEEIVHAIRNNHPIPFATVVDEALQYYFRRQHNGDDALALPKSSVGRHAMIIVGYRRRADGKYEFLIRNSWGLGGLSDELAGHFWMSEEWMLSDETRDLTVPTRMDPILLVA